MALVGTLTYQKTDFVYAEDSFVKGSRQLILISETDLSLEDEGIVQVRRGETYYRSFKPLDKNYLIGILDPVRKLQYGTTQVLNLLYQDIGDIEKKAKLNGIVEHQMGIDIYKDSEGNEVRKKSGKIVDITLNNYRFQLRAREVPKLNLKSRSLAPFLKPVIGDTQRYSKATFLDASLEYLERVGFDTSWMKVKKYIPIHTMQDWYNKVETRLVQAYRQWVAEGRPKDMFVVSIDFESTGLLAFCAKHPNPDKAVYFSISFADDESFGVFLDMEHFTNVDNHEMAERLTYLFSQHFNDDRDIVIETALDKLEIKRSEFTVAAHNMMIDRRFGLTFGADIWFDLCSNQISFNLDPYLTQGKNGLKHIVTKFFGVEYAELGDICGKRNKGMFKHLTDIRVIMMYGCADTDWHRKAVYKLLQICKDSIDYYGIDHVAKHQELDIHVMNYQAKADFMGMRVNLEQFKKDYNEKIRILELYYDFMSKYVGRVQLFNEYENAIINAERYGVTLKDSISKHKIDNALPYKIDSWTGEALIKTLFNVLNYPVLEYTTQGKKSKLEGRAFKPKPAVKVGALKEYLKIKPHLEPEELNKAISNPQSITDLKWYAMYLHEDFVDPVTGKVLISKDKFNSSRYPFMKFLIDISPITKQVSAELKPIVANDCEYRFASCNTTSAVTRRILNPMQTVSGRDKYKYLSYTDQHNYGASDQAAVEIRILNGLSEDPNLIEPLNDPEKDSHTETAALMHQRPAYTIDKKTRKGIKFLAFGRPYGKEVWSSCLDFFGNNDPENMAVMAELFDLYDQKLAAVMTVLNTVRDEMEVAVDMPPSLFEYLELDPEKEYGRMRNRFGYCQHLEIRRDDQGYTQALRRKAGNFIVQGFASNVLRIIYKRLIKRVVAEGWDDGHTFLMHLPVHDEVDFSYDKNLNPVKLVKVLNESLTIRIPGFPVLYVGINFGNSWGESKEDASEIPVNLVKELIRDYDAGKYPDDYDFGNHADFFAAKRQDYYVRRIWKELHTVNKGRNIWDLEFLSNNLQNYTVRSYISEAAGGILIPSLKESEDPVENLGTYLPVYIAKYAARFVNSDQYLVLGKKHIKITEDILNFKYASLDDLFAGKPLTDDETNSEQVFDFGSDNELSFDDDDLDLYDFDDSVDINEDEYPTDGITDGDISFFREYRTYRRTEKEYVEYASVQERIEAEVSESLAKKPSYMNFKLRNGRVILERVDTKQFGELIKFCKGRTSNSGEVIKLYVKVAGSLKALGTYKTNFLTELDEFLGEVVHK